MPTLYGVGLSPFVRKVRVVLAEKGIPYDHDAVMPSNPDPEFRKMSPLRFDYLEGQLGDGTYLVGKQLTIGDVAVASMFVNLFHAGERVDPKRWPRVAKYVATHHERPAFAPLIAEERGFLGLS